LNSRDNSKESFKNRQRLAEALRTLCAEVVASDAPDELFAVAVESTEAFAEELRGRPRRKRPVANSLEEAIRVEGKRYHYAHLMDFSPLAGPVNPVAPPMRILKEDEDTLVGFVVFPASFEGGPGLVHGGYIAAVFDEVLGLVQSLSGKAGMTGTLKVRYRSPCPLYTELRVQGKVHSVDKRKVVAKGTMHRGEQLVADAEATFIILERDSYRKKVVEHLEGKE
jgi:acyl-coenzyme A thioesterase PaaI-like protein